MKADLVGLYEIAQRLALPVTNVGKWRERSSPERPHRMTPPFPAARWELQCGPVWDWNKDIQPWLEKRGSKEAAH